MIKETALPAVTTFKDYLDKTLAQAGPSLKINHATREASYANFDGEIIMGKTTLRNLSYDYLTSDGKVYGVGFVAEKTTFPSACEPLIQTVIATVSVH